MPWAIETGTSDGSLIAASGTKCTPVGKSFIARAASAMDNLVLPQPPGPVRVSSLLWSRRYRAWASSFSLPTKLVRGRGSRPGASLAHLTAACAAADSPPEAPVITGGHLGDMAIADRGPSAGGPPCSSYSA